jgi:hypothetical protein
VSQAQLRSGAAAPLEALSSPPAPPANDGHDGPTTDFTPECHMAPAGAAPFTTGADFGPAVPSSLANWDASG